MLGRLFGSCQASLWIPTEVSLGFVFLWVVSFILTSVTSNVFFLGFCIIVVHDCVWCPTRCHGGPDSIVTPVALCHFLKKRGDGMDIQRKTFAAESKRELTASLWQCAVLPSRAGFQTLLPRASEHYPLPWLPFTPDLLHEAMRLGAA